MELYTSKSCFKFMRGKTNPKPFKGLTFFKNISNERVNYISQQMYDKNAFEATIARKA